MDSKHEMELGIPFILQRAIRRNVLGLIDCTRKHVTKEGEKERKRGRGGGRRERKRSREGREEGEK